MKLDLLQSVDPLKLARQEAILEGEIRIAALSRVLDHPYVSPGQQSVLSGKLHFCLEGQRFPRVKGHFHGQIRLVCQRCLAIVNMPLDIEAEIVPVLSEEALEQLPDPAQGWVLDPTKKLLIQSWIEEEILLWMPMVVRHPENECDRSSSL